MLQIRPYKKTILITLLVLIASISLSAPGNAGNSPIGVWVCTEDDGSVNTLYIEATYFIHDIHNSQGLHLYHLVITGSFTNKYFSRETLPGHYVYVWKSTSQYYQDYSDGMVRHDQDVDTEEWDLLNYYESNDSISCGGLVYLRRSY